MSESHVLYRIEGHIAIITINRPEAKNAFSPEMITLWRQFLEEAKADDQVRVIIVTGKRDALLSETEDRQEAARAFLEKRKPTFVGK